MEVITKVESKEYILVEAIGQVLQIGGGRNRVYFEARDGFKFPVAEVGKLDAIRLVKGEEQKRPQFQQFRFAVPFKKRGPKAGTETEKPEE